MEEVVEVVVVAVRQEVMGEEQVVKEEAVKTKEAVVKAKEEVVRKEEAPGCASVRPPCPRTACWSKVENPGRRWRILSFENPLSFGTG